MTPGLAVAAMWGAMAVFGANFVVSRYATQHGLTAGDLVALRYAVAGPLLLPLFARRGLLTCAGLGWRRGLALFVTSGAPMTLLMNTGLSLAPASHGAALGPGTVTVVGVVYAIVMARRIPSRLLVAGLASVLAGLAAVAAAGTATGSPTVVLGDLCFFGTGLLWGFYSPLLSRWRVDPMTGAAVCSVLSLVYLPIHLAAGHSQLLSVEPGTLVVQGLFQGIVNMILGLWLWGVGVRALGQARTQLFPPLIPVIGTALAIPALGEWPDPLQTAGLALIVVGLLVATRGNRAPPPVPEH